MHRNSRQASEKTDSQVCSAGSSILSLILSSNRLYVVRFYKETGEIVAIKMIDLEAELLNDEKESALTAIALEI